MGSNPITGALKVKYLFLLRLREMMQKNGRQRRQRIVRSIPPTVASSEM